MTENRVWVEIEVNKRTKKSTSYRGSIAVEDFDRLVSGTFGQGFLRLEHVHWDNTVWNPQTERHETKYTIGGQSDGTQDWTGTYFIAPDTIVTAALLDDSSGLFDDGRGDPVH